MKLIDGFTATMPDTEENLREFPKRTKKDGTIPDRPGRKKSPGDY